MAHKVNFNGQTGKHAFFSVKEKAWHGLGQIVQDYPTSAAALRFAGLDFTVEKRKLFTDDNQNLFGSADTITPPSALRLPPITGSGSLVLNQVQSFRGVDNALCC